MKVEGELVPMAMLELLHQQEEIFKVVQLILYILCLLIIEFFLNS